MTLSTDLTITTEKLMDLFESANPEKVDVLGKCLDLPQPEIDKIMKNYRSPTPRREAYLDMYVHRHPCPNWYKIVSVLRDEFSLNQQAELVNNTYVKGTQATLCSSTVVHKITSCMCIIIINYNRRPCILIVYSTYVSCLW